MQVAERVSIYDDFLEFVIEKASPEAVLNFQLSEHAQDRATELLDRQDEGLLTPGEAEELDQMRYFDLLVGMLKAKALAALACDALQPA